MSTLKIVCLISGGKDSLFSILHCIQNGHEVVALANLHPPLEGNEAVDDLDSYMYQTIGHAVIPLYSKALGLPLYRQEIHGSAVNQDKCYGPGGENYDQDETEALVPLLRKVKAEHPDLTAVSSGAILSDYQRTRVESVAIRLGLTPLSYLWQYPSLPPHSQRALLEDMAAAGQDSRIVKVASGGLDEGFLWQKAADSQTINRLEKAATRFGSPEDGSVLGEGGEYETLSVAGPAPLWKGRIVVSEDQRQVLFGDAGSASVKVLGAHVELHAESNISEPTKVRTPSLLEADFQEILDSLTAKEVHGQLTTSEHSPQVGQDFEPWVVSDVKTDSELPAGHLLVENVTGEGSDAAEQTHAIMKQVQHILEESRQSFVDIVYTSIVLRDMADFTGINAIYSSYFTHPNPPARATISCASALPPGKDVMISLTSAAPSVVRTRKGLHVQSRSYWAPANIGPYSQAISMSTERDKYLGGAASVYVAGQIPLVPASMELAAASTGNPSDDFLLQTVLALQHAVRIGRVMQVSRWACAIGFVSGKSLSAAVQESHVVREVWAAYHERHLSDLISTQSTTSDSDSDSVDDDFDVWHLKYGHAGNKSYSQSVPKSHGLVSSTTESAVPPLYIIQVDALPKDSPVEWAVYGLTKEAKMCATNPHFEHLVRTFRYNIVSGP